jgi:hypothetical protein
MEPHLKVQSSVTAGGEPMASVCHHLLYDGIQWDLMGFTRWLFNIAMEAMAHLQMVYLLKMVDLSMAMLVTTRWYLVYIVEKYHGSMVHGSSFLKIWLIQLYDFNLLQKLRNTV